MKTQQHGPSTNDEERVGGLVEDVSQDVERNRGDDRRSKSNKGHEEVSRRGRYNNYGIGRNHSDSQH